MKIRQQIWAEVAVGLFLIALVTLCIYPIRDTMTRAAILFTSAMLWLSILWRIWTHKKMLRVYLGVSSGIILFLCMPHRSIQTDSFRACYVRCLESYESVPYVWGAEGRLAVDCSGLIRQGYIEALWVYGLKTFNGALVREGLLVWLHDSSAKALRDGFRGRTQKILDVPSINGLDGNLLKPGDFAVTRNGVHCLAYLGDNRWIQADPGAQKVVINHVPVPDSGWYEIQVYIMRWAVLE